MLDVVVEAFRCRDECGWHTGYIAPQLKIEIVVAVVKVTGAAGRGPIAKPVERGRERCASNERGVDQIIGRNVLADLAEVPTERVDQALKPRQRAGHVGRAAEQLVVSSIEIHAASANAIFQPLR